MLKQLKFITITLFFGLITTSDTNCMFSPQANRLATQHVTRLTNTQKALEVFKKLDKRFKSNKNNNDDDMPPKWVKFAIYAYITSEILVSIARFATHNNR